jgi:hypothetical protein
VSAQLKSFEGPDVQRLLDGIRRELGPGAKIDRAERIRVGGILGFFAKEHYRVVVEVPSGSDSAPAEAGLETPTTGGRSSRRSRRKNPPDERPAPPLAPSVPSVTGDVFSAMAEATDDVTEIGSISAVAPPPPVVERPAPPLARDPDLVTHAPVAEEPPPETVPESFDVVLTRVASTLGAVSNHDSATTGALATGPHSAPPSLPPRLGGDFLASEPEDIASGAAMFLAGGGPRSSATSPDPVRHVPRANDGAASAVAPRDAWSDGAPEDQTVAALRRVGLAGSVIATVSEGLRRGAGLEALLLQAFAHLGDAPTVPRQAGSLLVVVGDGVPARRLAAALAGDMGTDPAGVPFASRDTQAHMVATGALLVRSAEDAAERAPGWRRSQAAVVVVDASVTGADRSWATHMIAALRPTAVWGVVEATAKTEDIAAWVTDLGGVDALALEHLDATVSPAAVLGLGAPVARIDGQPATAARWVATVVDRINPCR